MIPPNWGHLAFAGCPFFLLLEGKMPEYIVNGQYYLHTNGDLIYKRHGGVVVEPGGFVVQVWEMSYWASDPEKFTHFLRNAFKAGARVDRIVQIACLNNLDHWYPYWRECIGLEPNAIEKLEMQFTHGRA